MLTIRQEQLKAFAKAVERNLECRLHTHAERLWPADCQRLGKQTVRQWIRQAIRRAGGYGIDDEYDLSRFVDLMFMVGPSFDTDEASAWIGQALRDASIPPGERLDGICRRLGQRWSSRQGPAAAPQ